MRLRIIFFGTAELARASLRQLARDSRFEVIAVVTQPDKPKGRDLRLHPSPVKLLAIELQLPVLQPLKARDPVFLEHLRGLAPDLMVVAAYGQILPQSLLDLPPHGCLNVHTSLLPKYRGAAPIQWAIANGDSETGVTIMKMDAGLDTGPVLAAEKTTIREDDNSQTLHDRLAQLGADLLTRTIPRFVAGELKASPQSGDASHARKISREDGEIDWSSDATRIWNRLRAFTPWPGAFTFYPRAGGRRLLKIWAARPNRNSAPEAPGRILSTSREGIEVACGEGTLLITELQREGSRRMPAAEFLAAGQIRAGDVLGQS